MKLTPVDSTCSVAGGHGAPFLLLMFATGRRPDHVGWSFSKCRSGAKTAKAASHLFSVTCFFQTAQESGGAQLRSHFRPHSSYGCAKSSRLCPVAPSHTSLRYHDEATLLTLILVVSLVLVGRVHGEQNAVASSSSSSSIIDEFADTNEAGAGVEYNYFERHLQTSETTTCNFWCQLKNSLGLTIVGLLLICIR